MNCRYARNSPSEGVNELESSKFPSLHNRKEGRAASSIKFCAATEADAAGVVFLLLSIGKPPRPRVSGGFAIFINRSATPPFLRLRAFALALRGGGARRGILRPDNFFTPSIDRRYS
jgi:hypothetical protein